MLVLVLFLLLLGVTLSLPFVQTKIGAYVTDILLKEYKCDIKVEKVSLTLFGTAKLKTVLIRDHHKDTLFYANRIQTNILSFEKLTRGDLIFGDVRIDGLFFNLKQYKNEKDNNLDRFIALFETGEPPSEKHFLLTTKNAYLSNTRFLFKDENSKVPVFMDATKLNISASNLKIYGPEVSVKINKMSFKDHRGLFIKNLSGRYTYSKKQMVLDDFDILTKNSALKGKAVLIYKIEDFSDFNNKVKWDLNITESNLSSTDVRHFYNELGKNRTFSLESHITGTLNDLTFHKLHLLGENKSEIIGDVNFKNLFGEGNQKFFMKGNFKKVNSNYANLVGLLPNILGKTLPTPLKKLGQFDIKGDAEVTLTAIKADFFMTTNIGNIKSKLLMSNIDNIDNASYSGNVIFDKFNLGYFLNKKEIGKVSFSFNVAGKGFTEKYLDTKMDGKISRLDFNKYSYSGININGNFKSPIFKGKLNINDPNLFMDFDGLFDLSRKENKYDFLAQIDYANLNKLNFIKDSVSVFKGEIKMKITGNSLDNLKGSVYVTEAAYQNSRDNYVFDDFLLDSSFDENKVRSITVHSPDVIEGKIVGRFKFDQLQKITENAFGSLYTNYKPNKVLKGQFLNFDVTVYNKIIEIFFPEIEIGTNTVLRGDIDSDKDIFKLNFSSPSIKAFDNSFDNIKVELDNKNEVYNAFIEMDSIKTKFYKVSDFSLINVNSKDTLFARTEFKGGKKGEDYYNLNLYHTIDKNKNNVIGIKKSEFKFKDYLWFLNENETDNKIVFDKKFKNIEIENFQMSHEKEKIGLNGNFQGINYKDLELDFENVNIDKILPSVDSLKVAGTLNGKINFKQNKTVYQPISSLTIDELNINDIDLGNLNLDIEGDENLKNFTIDSSLENENFESFTAHGGFSIQNKEPILDLDLRFDKFNLAVLKPLGADIISNIRGHVSGAANITGTLQKPDINGRLFLEKTGLTIPYLGVDYEVKDGSVVDLSANQFIFQNETITDTKYQTTGTFNGIIKHKMFSDWDLNMSVESDRLLALDTPYTEDSAYYGKAYIEGTASINGPTNGLVINVKAKSKKGTDIKIPISNSEASSGNSFIKFLNPLEKYNLEQGLLKKAKNYYGMELKFDLDLTRDADIEVILDRVSGHGMKGNGTGNILLEINTLGKFNMYGDYQVYDGYYNFKYKGLIDKRFQVKKFSSIVWEGDPMRARLDMEAVYTVPGGSNPATLIENSSVNKKIPTEVAIKITGSLSNPEPDFTITFPRSTLSQSEVQAKLADKEMRQTQALSLLATGSFISNEGLSQQNAVQQNVYQAAGSLFDNLFMSPDDKVKVNVNLVPANYTPGKETEGNVGFTVSTQINDRIKLNGNLGVPIGGLNQSAVVGNVKVEYRVNDDGTLNLRFFNRENDINYIGQGTGYTQGIGVTYEVDFNTFNELMDRILRNQKVKLAKQKAEQIQDSDINHEYINYSDQKKKKNKNKSKSDHNKEAVPQKENDPGY